MKKSLILSLALVGLTLAGCAAEETDATDVTVETPAEVVTEPAMDDTTMIDDAMMDDTTMIDGAIEEVPADSAAL
jgi:PBP1b-binding outer membrane lipoprotein LpoB